MVTDNKTQAANAPVLNVKATIIGALLITWLATSIMLRLSVDKKESVFRGRYLVMTTIQLLFQLLAVLCQTRFADHIFCYEPFVSAWMSVHMICIVMCVFIIQPQVVHDTFGSGQLAKDVQ